MGSQMDIIACWVAEGASARAVTRSTRCARRPRLRWPAAAAAAAEATAAEEAPAAEEAATATASPVRLLVRAEKTAEEEATATASPVRLLVRAEKTASEATASPSTRPCSPSLYSRWCVRLDPSPQNTHRHHPGPATASPVRLLVRAEKTAEEEATATASPVRLLVRAEEAAEEEATATASPVRLAWTEEAGLLVDEEHDVGCVSASARGSLGRVGRHLHRSTAACPVRLLDLQQQTCLLHRLAATFAPPPMPPPPAPPHGPPPHMPDWETCPHQKLC